MGTVRLVRHCLVLLILCLSVLATDAGYGAAQTDFLTFWKTFKSAVASGNKTAVAEMTEFPMSLYSSHIKNRAEFLGLYGKIFNGEANAAQCFASAESRKESARGCEIYCPFKETPEDWGNAPIRFEFELTKSGWKFAGLDNVNE